MLIHLSTVVWGPWHTQAYLEVNLPSLLASGNLPALAARHQAEYFIYTTEEDIPRIEASAAFIRARAILPIKLIAIQLSAHPDPIAAHHAYWRESMEEARRGGAILVFIPPDVIWANGAFAHVAAVIDSGKRAILMTYLRVISETVVAEVKTRFGNSDASIVDAPARSLVALALRHLHPLTLTYVRDSQNFPVHPEFILWTVPGEGLLMRILAREVFAIDPNLFELTPQALLAKKPDLDTVHFVSESDDLFAMSLAPFAKDVEWYLKPTALSVLDIARWWLIYDSPANDVLARQYFRFHTTEMTPAKWRRAEIESDYLIRRLIATREVLRAIVGIPRPELKSIKLVVLIALTQAKLATAVPWTGGLTFLLPDEQAMYLWLRSTSEDLLAGNARALLDVIRGHILLDKVDFFSGRDAVLRAADGGTRYLTWQNGSPLIDGVFLNAALKVGDHVGYAIATVLPPTLG